MLRNVALAACCSVALAIAVEPSRVPVLVELFTSEGCSSCPPADRLLQQLDPQTIVLSEHVDYWDHQGWRDPFSSHTFTARQEGYVRVFSLDGSYTPEMVVDGSAEFVGSDGRRAADEVTKAAHRPKAAMKIARTATGIAVDVDAVPAAADVMLAVADPSAQSSVAAGENKGRNLRHVAVVRSLRKVGSVKRGAAFHSEIALPQETAGQRIVVFVQESGPGRVLAASMLEPYKPAP